MICYDSYYSPIWRIIIAASDGRLCALHLESDRYFMSIPTDWVHAPAEPILRQTQQELAAYFAGSLSAFSVPIAVEGTAFQEQVWQALEQIPPGQTTSYAKIARQIGKPKAVRAVGTAVGRNPICIVIPCHRVLTSSGELGGYVAGLDRKKYLLNLEQKTHS